MMGFIFGLIKRLIKWSIYFAIFFAIVVFIPNLPPYSKFSSIPLEPTLKQEGPLASNGALNNAQKLFKGKLLGPESFNEFEGEVYTSLVTGELVKLSPGGHVTFVTKLGQPCAGLYEESKCGRPLDFEFLEKERKLIVADAYYGIWKVDLKTDKKQLLVSPRVEIEGKIPRIFNSLALDVNGDFFWTDSCTDYGLVDGTFCTLTDPSGRLLHYSAAKNQSTVLLDKLWFANGVEVSPDRQFVVVAETARYRLMKYYLAGPKKGTSEAFISGLPGTPDNVRALPDGSGVLVGLYKVFNEENPLLMRSLAATPLVRKFLARLATLVETPFVIANSYFPHLLFQTAIYHIGNFATLAPILPQLSGLVHVDWNGKVVATYYNTDKSLTSVSDGIVVGDQLYLGSPYLHDFVGAVPAPEALKKAFAAKKAPVKQDTPKAKAEPVKAVPQKKEEPAQAKPAAKPTPAPTAKPVEAPKPTTPPPAPAKPVESKPAPKPAETKPAPAKPVESKPAPSKPAEAKPTPAPKKEEPKAKPVEPKTSKPTESQEEKRKTKKATEGSQKKTTKKTDDRRARDEIPIVEEIREDTVKPKADKLKVIKKGEGPTEIPNPQF